MRKDRAVLQMASVQSSGATGGASGERHVLGGIEALVAGTVELTPQPPCLVVVLPCCVILKVQNQPQFETRVGYGELDAIRAGLLNGLYESWMVPWPLDIEHAPELIDLRFLVDGPAAGLSGHGYECSRNGSALPGLDPEVNSRHVSHRWLPFKGVEISGSVLSPSQKTTSVFRGCRVATFRLSGRAPALLSLPLTVRRWARDRERAAA